jgi:uncharacterized membrane protein YhaH (DUF805 family)
MKFLAFLLSPKGRIHRFPFVYTWCLVGLIFSMASVFAIDVNFLWFAPLFLWPVTVKRLHDVNLHVVYSFIIYQVYGLWGLYLLGLQSVEFIGYTVAMTTLIQFMLWPSALCVLYLMLKKGHQGTNEYGIDPTWKMYPRVPLQEFLTWSQEEKIAKKGH